MSLTPRSLFLSAWLGLAACDTDGKLDETVTGDFADGGGGDGGGEGDDPNDDDDGDGFPASEDCDDADPNINPAATEVCDGVDNDCDGIPDPPSSIDASDWFFDGDADGYGNAAISETACEAPADYVDNPDDCEDNDAAINPVATEVCNLFDDDCDGLIDDRDDSLDPSEGDEYFLDADSDGYGDAETPTRACQQPDDHVTNADDCDDSTDAANPAAAEVCDDIDNDCNGLIDDDDPDVDLSTTRVFYLDDDGDGYGRSNATTLGCSLPSGYSVDDTDCDDEDSSVNPGATEVCDEDDTDEDCDRLSDDADDSVDLSTGSTWYTDQDGDSYGDSSDAGLAACDDPSSSSLSYVLDATDCDDASSGVHPGATEICDEDDTDEDCDGLSDDADSSVDSSTATLWHLDADGDTYGDSSDAGTRACDDPSTASDTYVADATDCDDGDGSVNPGATEVCDEDDVDEDCNGLADDADSSPTGASTWYPDADADTYGDSSDGGSDSCDDPSTASLSWVSDNTDCDDSSADVNPSATEVCDEDDTDEDCDGLADDADSSVDSSTLLDWYPDIDEDSYGDDSATASAACDNPSTGTTAYVTDNSDCDDSETGINPGADEVCDASDTDEDCDGFADDDDSSVDTTTATRWHIDADGDTYGDSSDAGSLACDDPSTASDTYVADDSDCDDGSSAINPAATEVCDPDDTDEDCDGLADDADSSVDLATSGTDYYPDADADGYGDSSATATASCDDPTTSSDAWTTDDSDCDDSDEDVNPAATELCNGVDDDCDATTSEAGMASFVSSSGTSDLTSSWASGTSSSPASWSASDDGTLFVCADTWYVHIDIDGYDVDIEGVDGSASCILDGGSAGTVVTLSDSTATLSGLTLQNGSASYAGGLYVESGTLIGSDLVFTGNSAGFGGGLYSYFSAVDLTSSTFTGNSASYDGGAIIVDQGSTTELDGCSLTSNTAGRYGGAIIYYYSTGAQSIVDSELSNNIATEYGGAIECWGASAGLSIVDSTLETNAATNYYGGAIDADDCELDLEGVELDGNSAVRGGAIYTDSSFSTVDVDITNNSTSYLGGGIAMYLASGESCTMSGGSIEDNTASSFGGGVYASLSGTGTYDVSSTDFSGNSPYSVRVASIGNYTYGASASFSCDSAGCR